MIKKIFIIFSIFFITMQAAAAGVFDHPQKLSEIYPQLPELKNVNCKFKQEKTLPNTTIPLISSGDFQFIKEKGIVFKTKYPIESTTSYNAAEFNQINDVINAISNKSFSKIENIFDFYFTKTGEDWTLGFIPKKSHQASKYLASVEIEGRNDISKITIKMKNSTETTIRFYK